MDASGQIYLAAPVEACLSNESAILLAQIDFLTQKVFRISAAAQLVAFALTNAPYHARRPRFVASLHEDSLAAQAAFAKIDILSNNARFIPTLLPFESSLATR
ncbi:MAG: hypothetical protein KJ710_03250 [Candidatus Omnitrophica bacterium]|nr:hypothetical protein [Candidatus Omnitrophota bacterium]MBU1923267.1 hypothetical protein [Candidatus Omnitrophota bacterium]